MANYRLLNQATKDRKADVWHPLKKRMQTYLEKAGASAAIRLARALGCHSSQVHRWTCPVCEHDAEPTYSTGIKIIEFLDAWDKNGQPKAIPSPSINVGRWVKHRKGNPKSQRIKADTRNVLNALLPKSLRGGR